MHISAPITGEVWRSRESSRLTSVSAAYWPTTLVKPTAPASSHAHASSYAYAYAPAFTYADAHNSFNHGECGTWRNIG